MNASEVLNRFGTVMLLRFVLALVVFLALHLVRLPLLWLVQLLEAGMSGVDRAIAAAVSGPATGFRPGTTGAGGEDVR